MMRTSAVAPALGLAAFFAVLVPCPANAQTTLAISLGPAQYDLSDTGWSGAFGAHLQRAPRPWLRLDAGTGFFTYSPQFGDQVTMLLPEVGAAFQASGPVPIYLGIGLGHTVVVTGGQRNAATAYSALGLSIPGRGGLAFRPELRVRLIDWGAAIAEYTMALSYPVG